MDLINFTLDSGKKVIMRIEEVGDLERAALAIGSKAGDNHLAAAMMINSEKVKMLLVEVDGKKLSGNEKENLKSLFTLNEYTQILMVLEEMSGGKKPQMPQIGIVKSTGEK